MTKSENLRNQFVDCTTAEARFKKIIYLGQALPPFDPAHKIPENLVHGCQSEMYLHTARKDGRLFFNATSEALISKGLAALLIALYNDEPPETLFQHPPLILTELGIPQSLSPSRSNGLFSLYQRMKLEALKP